MVIRADLRWWTLDENHSFGDLLATLDNSIAQLPFLETLILETRSDSESAAAELMEKLPLLHGSGRVRRRTCKEAQRNAQEALRDPARYSKNDGVVSPLWFSDAFKGIPRETWCADALQSWFLSFGKL